VNVVMNLEVPQNAGKVACFLPGQAKDLSAPLYVSSLGGHILNHEHETETVVT